MLSYIYIYIKVYFPHTNTRFLSNRNDAHFFFNLICFEIQISLISKQLNEGYYLQIIEVCLPKITISTLLKLVKQIFHKNIKLLF